MSVVATATTVETGHAHPSVNRPNLTSVGTIIWLSSELMFFAALFAMYFTLRSVTGAEFWAEKADALNFPFSATNTTILVLSSLTCQLGVFAAERGDVKKLRTWFVITFVMGAIFIGGQVFEYTELVKHEGLSLSSDPYGSVFYLTTGFHGLHVIGGLIAFVILVWRTKISKFTPAQATSAIVVSYYWHFVDVVWIGLFMTIYIIR
jgi:cytochrome c oxidase subunit III